MNYSSQNHEFPLYSLFPNPATPKIDEHREIQTTNLPSTMFQNKGNRKSSKLAPIGTGRPLSKEISQTIPNFDQDKQYQSTIQTQANRRFYKRPSTLASPCQIDSTFEQTQWISQPIFLAKHQFCIMPHVIIPNELDFQNYYDSRANFSNVPQFDNKNKTMISSIPNPGTSIPIGKQERQQFFMNNPERYDANQNSMTAIQCTNQNRIICQPSLGAFNAMAKQEIGSFRERAPYAFQNQLRGAIPKQRESVFPGQTIRILKRQNHDAVSNQNYATGISEENNHNFILQRGSAQHVPAPKCEAAPASSQNSANDKPRSFIIYNSKYGRRSKNQTPN